jgi:hypothetical protein
MLFSRGQNAPRRGWILDFSSSAPHPILPIVLSVASLLRTVFFN